MCLFGSETPKPPCAGRYETEMADNAICALRDLLRVEDADVLGPPRSVVKIPPRSRSKAIWNIAEVPSEDAIGFMFDTNDKRKRAEFQFLYKQLVSSEDVYLGTTEKTPSSVHSNALVYKVSFPGHSRREIDVDATRMTLRVESSQLKLALYLPQPVNAKSGSAQWDSNTSTISITLPLS